MEAGNIRVFLGGGSDQNSIKGLMRSTQGVGGKLGGGYNEIMTW